MAFGYSTNAFVKFNLTESLEKIAALGFAGAEIMCDRPHLYPPDYPTPAVDHIRATLERLGLAPTNLNSFTLFAVGDTYLPSWIEPQADRRAIRVDHTRHCLRIAKQLGCATISVPPGGPVDGMTRRQAFRIFHEGLDQVLPLAEELGVQVLIEPEPGLLMENSRQIRTFISHLRCPAAGINFDIGHFYCAGEDPATAFETLRAWVGHVHIEDIAPSRVHNHLIPGLGAIDFAAVLATMKRLDYRGHISLELYPYVDAPEDAGRRGLAHLKPFFAQAGIVL